jgi:hypothetical protein
VPQLAFNKEECPARINLAIAWDQLQDDWHVSLLCISQAGSVQESYGRRIPDGFKSIDLGIVLMDAFVNWLDSTPAYTRLQLMKALSRLSPDEVPVGISPREVFAATDPSLGGRPGYSKRQFKPRRR